MTGAAELVAQGWQALQAGRPADAARLGRAAVETAPYESQGWLLLGAVCHTVGQLGEAAGCYQQALALQPALPEALANLGSVLQSLGRPVEAVDCCRRALVLRPEFPEAFNNLGNALHALGRPDEAETCFRQALALRPDYVEGFNNLGNALIALGRANEAEETLRRALALRPDFAEAHYNLGNAVGRQGRSGDAEACYRRALELRPAYPEAHSNLGALLLESGRPGAAEVSFRRALELRPDLPGAATNLGLSLRNQGRCEEAEVCLRQALAGCPDAVGTHDALLLTLHYRAGVTPEQLAAEHADYDRRHAAPLRADWRPHANGRDPERPLRLGFVSSDLGRHPVGYLLVRAAEALARRPCTVVCYSDRRTADDLTERFRTAASVWRDTAGLSDPALADQVRADAIDILIDLAGHTAGNRLLAFARKPAPVQATWLGYVGTTGLAAIDYLIADDHQVPPGAEVHYRERVLRLPGGYACYDPPAAAPDPGPPPALATGRVTFGCFNNPAKLSPPALAAFAAVLNRVAGARLVLKYGGMDDPAVSARLHAAFAAAGVAPERVELRGGSAHAGHLAAYREVDVALDSFPYSGGVTTCDALWMGVPVVTLPGTTFASRHSLSYLAGVGLADDLATSDVDDYVARAADLANDWNRLAGWRAGLRERMARSPLCNGERLADELLQALRVAWRAWAIGGSQ
jgi:predicted O-linked N-acetylglucosamine transferase (SPINDLY family)